METVTINGKEYAIRYTLNTQITVEQYMEEVKNLPSIIKELSLYYACITSANKGCTLQFIEFKDALDADLRILKFFRKWITPEVEEFRHALSNDDDELGGSKKKETD